MCNSPLVSIVAVCYNHEEYVVETLNSIVDQTYANIQLIIMEDYSSDNSVQVIKDWIKVKNVECTFIPHKENRGLCKTLNEALTYVNGEYYQAISCDDVLMHDKISKQVSIFKKYPDIAVVSSNMKKIDSASNILDNNGNNSNSVCGLRKANELFKILLLGCIIEAPTVLIKKSYLPNANVYDENLISEDWDLWLKLALNYDFYIMEEALVKYRILPTSLSSTLRDSPKKSKEIIIILSKYLGLQEETDQLIKRHVEILKRKLYNYTFSALYTGATPAIEYFVKLKSLLRFNNRVKNLKKQINQKSMQLVYCLK